VLQDSAIAQPGLQLQGIAPNEVPLQMQRVTYFAFSLWEKEKSNDLIKAAVDLVRVFKYLRDYYFCSEKQSLQESEILLAMYIHTQTHIC